MQRRRNPRLLETTGKLLAAQHAVLKDHLIQHGQRLPRPVENDLWNLLTQLRYTVDRITEERAPLTSPSTPPSKKKEPPDPPA